MIINDFYVTTYCNKAHRCSDGKPIKHECRILPHQAIAAERSGDYARAIELISNDKPRYMRRGVR